MFSLEKIYEVTGFLIGETKSKAKMGKLQLKDTEDESVLNCILWEETLNRLDENVFRCGNKLRLISASFNEKFNNCLINSVELVELAKIGIDKKEQDNIFNLILEYVNKIKDDSIKSFLNVYFEKYSKEIKIAPAAKKMHHNYVGGLLVHTMECLKIADSVMQATFQKLNSDEVYAACILHDIGKIFEYNIDEETGAIDYNDKFTKEWITHTQYAFSMCMTSGFTRIGRMIAAHHARTEWGAILDLNTNDLESYVYLIHHIDDLSAKYGKISAAML